jgi:plasmid stabilization system protein ParE
MVAAVVFHYLAAKEFRQARSWYARRSVRTAFRFIDAVNSAVEQLAASPQTWPLYDEQHQWFKLRKFPYLLIFRTVANRSVVIMAVAHSARRPGYWRRRRFPFG